MKNKLKQLLYLKYCTLILSNEKNQIIGIGFEIYEDIGPYLVFKEDSPALCQFFIEVAKNVEINIVENSPIVKELFEHVKEDYYIPEEYYEYFAKVYARFYNTTITQSGFDEELQKDIYRAVYRNEKDIFMRIYKKWLKASKTGLSDQNEYNTINLKESLQQLAKADDFKLNESYDSLLNIHKFLFIHYDDEEKIDFWFLVIVDDIGKILVGNRYVLHSFDAGKADYALGLVKAFLEKKKRILKNRKAYIKDFTIPLKLYDFAVNSIKIMLEINSQQNGFEFCIIDNKAIATIYLHKRFSRKMYIIVMSYREFMKNPDVFKELIAKPYRKKEWNFWCREYKYKKEHFSK